MGWKFTLYRFNILFKRFKKNKDGKLDEDICEIINLNNIPVIYDERLEERDCGKLTNTDLGEFYYTDYWNYYSNTKVEGLEPIKKLFKRVKDFLDEIKERYENKNILLVIYGGIARGVYFYFNE